MNQLDIFVLGDLRVDAIFAGLRGKPECGGEILANDFRLGIGGSGAVFASNIARLGVETGFIGKIGNDQFGRFILDTFQEYSIDTSQIKFAKEVRTGCSFILNHSNEQSRAAYLGAIEDLTIEDIDFDNLKGARHFHLSAYYSQSGLRSDIAEIFYRAKKLGLRTSLDTNWDPAEEWSSDIFNVLRHVDIFLPNEIEAKAITHSENLEDAIGHLAEQVEVVVVKRGDAGAVACRHNEILHVEAHQVMPVDSIGVGDSFNAGFIAKSLAGGNLATCLEFGNLCGAYSTQRAGGTAAFSDPEAFAQFVEERANTMPVRPGIQSTVINQCY